MQITSDDDFADAIKALSGLKARNDCAFCHWERSAKDDNHAPNCPYWDFFEPREEAAQ